MSGRVTQLANELCEQDQLILDLFKDKLVKFVGSDLSFARNLSIDPMAANLVAIYNTEGWVSNLIDFITLHLCSKHYTNFYFGINRYQLIGNNTNLVFDSSTDSGQLIIDLIDTIAKKYGYQIQQSGYYDNDFGKKFNFIQPLTWVYGTAGN